MQSKWERSHRRVLTEFIQIYRSEPCLWMVKAPEYRDRQLKDAAYDRLSRKLREIDSTADREKAVKKINSLRTNYRKVKKKLDKQVDTTSYTSSYRPSLWYYDLFEFLDGHEIPGPNPFDANDTQDPYDDYGENESDPLSEVFRETDEIETETQVKEAQQRQELKTEPLDKRCSSAQSQGSSIPEIVSVEPRRSKSKRPHLEELSDESDYAMVPKRRKISKNTTKEEDRYDIFARIIALKLRTLTDNKQRILAEKAINDALFLAEMGELTLENVSAPMNLATLQNDMEYLNSSATEENVGNGMQAIYPSGKRY